MQLLSYWHTIRKNILERPMSKVLISKTKKTLYEIGLAVSLIIPIVAYQFGHSNALKSVNYDSATGKTSNTYRAANPANQLFPEAKKLSESEVLSMFKEWLPTIKLTENNIVYHERVGLYQLVMQSEIFYVSDDGSAIMKGDVYDTAMIRHDPERANLTEQFQRALAFTHRDSNKIEGISDVGIPTTEKEVKTLLASIPAENIVTFPAEGVAVDTFYVFFDITCPECKKLTPEITDLQKMGFDVKLVLVSRNGKNTNAFKHSSELLCQTNPATELMLYTKRGFSGFSRRCSTDISPNMEAAALLRIRGTPTTIRYSDAKLYEGLHYATEMVN